MNSLHIRLIAFCCLFCTSLRVSAADKMVDKEHASLELSAKLQYGDDSGYAIDFMLQNIGRENISMYRDYLPWRTGNALTLVAIPLNRRDSPLSRTAVIEDPTVAFLDLKPGESIDGKIVLANDIPGLAKCLRKGDVAIFWAIDAGFLTMNGKYGRWSGTFILDRLPTK